jgi:hypothetical protein
MTKTLFINANKWYKVILVWELYRIPYNILMALAGSIGMFFMAVNIPLVYLLVGITFNIFYTFLCFIDLGIKTFFKRELSKVIFCIYFGISAFLVISIPVASALLKVT